MKTLIIAVISVLFLSGCVLPDADPPPPPDTPVSSDPVEAPIIQPGGEEPDEIFLPSQPGDDLLQRGLVFLDSTDVLLLESFPVQVNLVLKGSLPTPCHQGRVTIQPPDSENTIRVELYSVVNPDQVCIQMLQEFETTISLGPLPAGHYNLQVNEEPVITFDT